MNGEHMCELKDFVMANIHRWEALQEEAKALPEREIYGVNWLTALSREAGKDPERDLQVLLRLAQEHRISGPQLDSLWTWKRLPFTTRQAGLALPARPQDPSQTTALEIQHDEFVADLDEWVLRNEDYLRLLTRGSANQASESPTWTFGLVNITQLPTVLTSPHDLSTKRIAISRPESLSGFCVLGDKRGDKILIQPSQAAFESSWSKMTGGVLKGLNWANLFAAGGSVLGSLVTPEVGVGEEVHEKEQWIGSDIDLYLWGLNINEANKRIEHVAQIYQENLPHGAPFVAARNSQTITLYSSWPTKRVQIILKLVDNPREVLLNFDLDPCAVGYDGLNVWMLPRFVRALETGYTTFTMDLIHGHYLGDRKATRDDRVFKYANKGFGIRMLPSYLSSCGDLASILALLQSVANESRHWTSRFIEFDQSWKFFFPKNIGSDPERIPEYSYSQLYMKETIPTGGCLSNFALFMRHVALWEQDAHRKIRICDNVYIGKEEGDEAYYDGDPPYRWSRDFNIAKFCDRLDDYNQHLTVKTEETAEYILFESRYSLGRFQVKRVTHSPSVPVVLAAENDLVLPVVMPKEMVIFANALLLKSLQEHGIEHSEAPLQVLYEDKTQWLSKGLCLVAWKLDMVLNWQLFDRRVDEIREILWEYYKRLTNRMTGDWNLLEYRERLTRRRTQVVTKAFAEWLCCEP
ncbi:hypothetical protein V5O48_003335 [Marasmius crinis-equi]|uniref:Uncharacterized protein n=1 Tax=Marasmius crinis-equi TaxID=585013 RepID=A0ABR3FTL6_9AGAR